MDVDTLILLILTSLAFGWWFSYQVREERKLARDRAEELRDRAARAKRVKQLNGKLG